MHDYGKSVRLEDAETGKTLVTLAAERDAAGKIIRIQRKTFLLNPLRLRQGHRYRIVTEYDSPVHQTIAAGGMANILGVFSPDLNSPWPALDPEDPTFKKDIESLPIVVQPTADATGGQLRTERINYTQHAHH